jgi:hypothetical protein
MGEGKGEAEFQQNENEGEYFAVENNGLPDH